ncbi:hypothetical protein BH23PLA1_BH23PLA1_06670 [soil metagenome]
MFRSNYESPHTRRLKTDLTAMERLRAESSVLRFKTSGDPPQRYFIEFLGQSLARERGKVRIQDRHQVEIKLGSAYPRTMPELRWLSPIYHPNISEIGLVCLGGYGTHWVPSLHLDELVTMLWDMARFHNYDLRSPYNREAALWAANQTTFAFPTDHRPLRDVRAMLGRLKTDEPIPSSKADSPWLPTPTPVPKAEPESVFILEGELKIEAERPTTRERREPPQEEVFFID